MIDFLVPLEREEWMAFTAGVVARLTDETIADAVRRSPPELHARDGAFLERALRKRRDALPATSEAFYRLLASEVDVHATGLGEARLEYSLDVREFVSSTSLAVVRSDEGTSLYLLSAFGF